MKRVFHTLGMYAVALPLLLFFAALLIGPPVMFALETIDLARMRSETQGQVDAIKIVRGGKGTSRAEITYHFQAGNRRIDSNRFFPGSWGNGGASSGGASVATDFSVGRPATVYFSESDPERCALGYGWFKWTFSSMIGWIGVPVAVVLSRVATAKMDTPKELWLSRVAFTCFAFGFGELFFGPQVVRVRDVHWHILTWSVICGGAALYAWGEKVLPKPASNPEAGSAAPREVPTTPRLALDLLMCLGMLVFLEFLPVPRNQVLKAANDALQGFANGFVNAWDLVASVLTLLLTACFALVYAALAWKIGSRGWQLVKRIVWHLSQNQAAPN